MVADFRETFDYCVIITRFDRNTENLIEEHSWGVKQWESYVIRVRSIFDSCVINSLITIKKKKKKKKNNRL